MNKKIILSFLTFSFIFSASAQAFCYDIECEEKERKVKIQQIENPKLKILDSKINQLEEKIKTIKPIEKNIYNITNNNYSSDIESIAYKENHKIKRIKNPKINFFEGEKIFLVPYTVQKGDTLASVCKKFDISRRRTRLYNHIPGSNATAKLYEGQELMLPVRFKEFKNTVKLKKKEIPSSIKQIPVKQDKVSINQNQENFKQNKQPDSIEAKILQKANSLKNNEIKAIVIQKDTYKDSAKDIISLNKKRNETLLKEKFELLKKIKKLKLENKILNEKNSKLKHEYSLLNEKYNKQVEANSVLLNADYDQSKFNRSCDLTREREIQIIENSFKFKKDVDKLGLEKATEMNKDFVEKYLK